MSLQAPRPGAGAASPKTQSEALEWLAETITARLDERQRVRAGWVPAKVVAQHLSVDVEWVYQRAGELGGIRLGDGPKARLRFRLATVDEAVAAMASCQTGRKLGVRGSSAAERKPRRRRSTAIGHSAPLLPVREPRAVRSTTSRSSSARRRAQLATAGSMRTGIPSGTLPGTTPK